MENLKNIQPIDNFDWDALEKGESYGSVSKEDLVKTYDETLNTVKDKEVVMGTVTAMNKREVVVNIGFKSDGVVPMSEFRYNPDLKIGDRSLHRKPGRQKRTINPFSQKSSCFSFLGTC